MREVCQDLRAFTHASRSRIAIVLKGAESVALFGSGVRSRTVPVATVSLKMIIGPRGTITVELELTRSRSKTRKEARHAETAIEIFSRRYREGGYPTPLC